mgnify:FL=1
MIISKTPLRISFSGGGSDLENFYSFNGGAVLSSSINKYIYVSVNKKFDEKIRLSYSKNEEVSSIANLKHPLVRETLDFLKIYKGIEITSTADIPSEGSGLGSSSSFTVGLLNTLSSFKKKNLSAAKLAKAACKIEIEICKEPIGKQDQYASAFGGFNLIEFKRNNVVRVRPILCKKETIIDLEKNIHLFYTGKSRKASLILKNQNEELLKNKKATENLIKMVSMTYELETKLNNNDLSLFGEYLHESWMLKKTLSKKISNSFIDEIYNAAINSGAEGGKLLGAGAGGFFLFYAKPKHKKKLLKNLSKLRLMPVTLNTDGSKIIYKSS